MSRAALRRAAVAAAAAATTVAACGGPRTATRGPRDAGVVLIESNVRDAAVYVDGKFVAPLAAMGGGVVLASGSHRLELRHDDYFSTYLVVDLARAERKQVVLELAPILP